MAKAAANRRPLFARTEPLELKHVSATIATYRCSVVELPAVAAAR